MNWQAIGKSTIGVLAAGAVAAAPTLALSNDPHLAALGAFLGSAVVGGILHQLTPPASQPQALPPAPPPKA